MSPRPDRTCRSGSVCRLPQAHWPMSSPSRSRSQARAEAIASRMAGSRRPALNHPARSPSSKRYRQPVDAAGQQRRGFAVEALPCHCLRPLREEDGEERCPNAVRLHLPVPRLQELGRLSQGRVRAGRQQRDQARPAVQPPQRQGVLVHGPEIGALEGRAGFRSSGGCVRSAGHRSRCRTADRGNLPARDGCWPWRSSRAPGRPAAASPRRESGRPTGARGPSRADSRAPRPCGSGMRPVAW